MTASGPSLRWPRATAAARRVSTPGRAPGGRATVTVRLFASSSRWNVRLSPGTAGHPGGGAIATSIAAGPRVRFVTVIVKWRGAPPPPAARPAHNTGGPPATKGGGPENRGPPPPPPPPPPAQTSLPPPVSPLPP